MLMMNVMHTADFQTQLTSIMEIMARTAVVEISKLFEENSLSLRLQISRCTNENESLKKKCLFLESELQSARKTGNMNGTEAPFSLTGTGHPPTIDNVFGKEWCMNLWRHQESSVGKQEDSIHLEAEETVDLLDEEPDVILIKEETLKNDDGCGKNKPDEDHSSKLTGPTMSSDERCVAQSSDDYITYTVPSDELQSNVQQPEADVIRTFDGPIPAHGDNLLGLDLIFDQKKFKCMFCERTFEYLSHMQRHMRTHSGEKPFVCIVCGKRFAQKTYLITHERTHSGEKPYSCTECGKSFAQKSALNVHFRSHTGEKPYSCSNCGKRYAFKIALKTHRC